MESIKEIYSKYTNSEEYEKIQETEEVKRASEDFEKYIHTLDTGTMLKIDRLVGASNVAYEEQGFMIGFNIAIRMVSEHGLKALNLEVDTK